MSNSTVELKERIPRIGEFYVTLDNSIWLCLGFSSYKVMTGIKVGGAVTMGNTILNFDALYPYLQTNISWALESKENFERMPIDKYRSISIKTLRKNDVSGRVLEALGVVDGFSIDEENLTVDLLTLKMVGLNIDNLYPHEHFQEIERANISRMRSNRNKLKSEDKLLKPQDLVVGKIYACLDEKPFKHIIYLGKVDDKYMFAGRGSKWGRDTILEQLYESEKDFEIRSKNTHYFHDKFGVYNDYMKIRCYKKIPNIYKESILHDDDVVEAWIEERDSIGVNKISVYDWAYERFSCENPATVLNRNFSIRIKGKDNDNNE